MSSTIQKIQDNLESVIRGKTESVRLVLTSLLAGGHLLLEDAPGTGKTTLAKALAQSIDGKFKRIQFTPDLLPADILGGSIYSQSESRFDFRPGPVFANVLLADEINRTSPRTQSALLEVMSEGQVTIEGERRDLPKPFFAIATQNPIEFHGTYPLPEAQLDRFAMRITLGYPGFEDEVDVLFAQSQRHPLEMMVSVVSCEEILEAQQQVRAIRVDRSVAEYMVRLVEKTRKDPRLRLPISTRGALALFRLSQARALIDQREFVTPDDVRALALPVLAHRIVLDAKTRFSGLGPGDLVLELLESVPVPR